MEASPPISFRPPDPFPRFFEQGLSRRLWTPPWSLFPPSLSRHCSGRSVGSRARTAWVGRSSTGDARWGARRPRPASLLLVPVILHSWQPCCLASPSGGARRPEAEQLPLHNAFPDCGAPDVRAHSSAGPSTPISGSTTRAT